MALLRVRMNLQGMTIGPAVSTLYFNGSGQTAADAAADAAHDFFEAAKGQIVNYGIVTNDPEVDELDTATGLLLASYAVTPQVVNGTASGDALGPATQGLLRLSTGIIVAGRQLKGHLFLPGAIEAANAPNGQTTSAYRSAWKGAADVLKADTLSDWVIWSRTHGVAHTVTGTSVWEQWGVLRSRRD